MLEEKRERAESIFKRFQERDILIMCLASWLVGWGLVNLRKSVARDLYHGTHLTFMLPELE